LNPDYQRGLVWDEENKTLLLNSIFNNIEIGKFSFIKLNYILPTFDWDKGIFYEILDGKQRLSVIKDFFEDKFIYKGYTFSQLSSKDRYKFLNTPIVICEFDEPENRKDIYEYFVKLNTTGKPIEKGHLEKILKMIEDKN